VSWTKLWAKAKENHARSRRIVWRSRAFMIGVILAGAGGYGLYSDVTHQIRGRPAMATLMAHIKRCTVEYQRIGEQKRKEQLPCEQAEEFQRRVGSNKVKLSRDYIAHVQFPLEDGHTREANVDDVKLGSYKLAIGATLPVIYAPDNPADVRAKMSWETFKVPLILLAIGIPCLALSFGVPLTALFGWGFRGRGDETVTATSEHLAPATQASERRSSNMVSRTAPRTSFGMRNR
jgi:uncharacterized protein DUF3592